MSNFPLNPDTNQHHTIDNIRWKFNGTAWNLVPEAVLSINGLTGAIDTSGISFDFAGISASNVGYADGTLQTTGHHGAYTGQIETAADKTYTLDPGAPTIRTITGFYIKSASGTVTAALKVGSDVVKSAGVSLDTGDQSSLTNTTIAVNDILTLVTSANDSALDVIFSVEYTE